MIKTVSVVKKTIRIAIIAVAIASLSACVARYRNHGYVPSEEELAEIVVGIDTRDSVMETVGPPSSLGVLNESGFYYVSSRVRFSGARAPQTVNRQLVAISFNASGVVQNIERFGLEDGSVIALERRVTDSSVEDKTFLRQLLGNLGRFDPGSLIN
ncbi:MAG: outer membrane protein assembly factor BamE (lipoprotein component of BamABCDE complex) [Paracoccaceae bacterium]|jgi:outer membrane protein assembly factor BamE (lipoprotein component of BamABCDE complex)